MDEILAEFLTESAENLDHLERDLVRLEESPDSRPLLAGIFRNVHTIKGSSGFIGLGRLEKVAHAGENLLSALRDGRIVLNAATTSGLLKLVDRLRAMLACIRETGTESHEDDSALIAELNQLLRQAAAGNKPRTPATGAETLAQPMAPAAKLGSSAAAGEVAPPPPEPVTTARAPSSAAGASHEPAGDARAAAADSAAENAVRVSVGLLDKLMNLVGELVLARNQILQVKGAREEAGLSAASQRLNLVTTELQEEVMKTRLQPINTVWSKFPRIVRDIAQELGKRVRLDLAGKETELDRTIIEAIKDLLTHIVRNSVDHGLETPADRRAAGKSEEGVLRLSAYHEGGLVNLEIGDDGRGIDVNRVRHKAVERGLITAEQAARMSESDALQLIFLPGLSTAEKVTNISGRGVGMDVVKTNIERIGGAIEIHSEPGRGTTIKIKIPLTLAIIPALMVHCGSEQFAIPQVSLLELVRIDATQAAASIEDVLGSPVYRLRGQLLPLVRLAEALKLESPDATGDRALNIVVVQADGRQFGLVVDRVSDTQEIVVKPLGRHLKHLAVFAGATVLGDGHVALILDVIGLARTTRVFSRERTQAQTASSVDPTPEQARQRLLLFTLDEVHRVAIDLSTVGRLEKFPRSVVERAGAHEVVQYRDRIMNLVRLSDCLGFNPPGEDENGDLHVIVYSDRERQVGLVVGRILDIVEDVVRLQTDGAREGVSGRAVIQGCVTEMLDVPGIVRQAAPELAGVN